MLKVLSRGLLHLKSFFRESSKLQIHVESYYQDAGYVKDFVYQWNLNFPLDRWYRSKYNISFNSPLHREISIIDIRHEWNEYLLYKEINRPKEVYNSSDKLFLKEDVVNRKEDVTVDKIKQWVDEFNELDLSQYDDE